MTYSSEFDQLGTPLLGEGQGVRLWLLPLLLCFTISVSAQNNFKYAVGQITDTSARIITVNDTIRGVHFWKAFTLSDHEGDKILLTAFKNDSAGSASVYTCYQLKPHTTYECVVMYTDTFVRDTFTTSSTQQHGKFNWQQGSITYKGKTYNKRFFRKMMGIKGRVPTAEELEKMKPEEDEED